jgi:circadian clock protein KaiC
LSSSQVELQLLSTGSGAFDRILGGGLPTRSVTVVSGVPGAGKTLFALQMLFSLAKQGRKGLYFTTLSEPSLKLIRYMQQFSFFDESAIGSRIVFADLGSVLRKNGAQATLDEIAARVEREEPELVVIDSFKAVRDILHDTAELRTFAYDVAVHSAAWGATTLLVGEYGDADMARHAEFAIADGVIRFSNTRRELTAVREVEVLKLRGADYVTGGHFYEIGAGGLAFFPRVRGPEPSAAEEGSRELKISSLERAETGVAGLDAMLGGGLPRTSATIVQGGTGTGKTLLGLQFLLQGAARGEPGIHFMLEETPDQLRAFAQALGWDLAPLESRGLLTLSYVSPVELSPDRFLDRARRAIERIGARRAVLDSLTSMALGVPSDRRFKELVYATAKHFHARGVTLTMNMEIADLLGQGQLSGYGVSFAADNVIQLKFLELDGRLERGISVLKARGISHATDVRKLHVRDHGIEVGAPFQGLRGVLTGLPSPANTP